MRLRRESPVSAASLAIMPLKLASMPSLLSLSHSRPRPVSGRRGVLDPGAGVPEAQDRPLARRHIPHQPPVGVHLRRQVCQRARLNDARLVVGEALPDLVQAAPLKRGLGFECPGCGTHRPSGSACTAMSR